MTGKTILIQACVCIMIAGGYVIFDKSDSEMIQDRQNKLVAAVSVHYTVQDVFNKGKEVISAAIKAPAAVTSYIISSQDIQKYGMPIDESPSGEVVSVYAVSGGQVIETGENSRIGKYVKIRHDEAISVYGNCNKIYVNEGKHVRQGAVIASFMNDGNTELHYELIKEQD